LRFYKKLGVQFVFAECEEPVYTSLHQLRVWLGLRLMNNLDLDEQKEIDRFMAAYYGKAAPYMRKYHDLLQKGNTALNGSLCDVPLNRRTDLNDNFFRTVLKWFDEAEKAVKDNPVILERLGKERNSIDTALLDKRSMLSKDLVPDPDAVAARLKKNYEAAVQRYTYPGQKKRRLDDIAVYCQGINANVPPLKFAMAHAAKESDIQSVLPLRTAPSQITASTSVLGIQPHSPIESHLGSHPLSVYSLMNAVSISRSSSFATSEKKG
jgi:hypothetical protein